MLNYLINRIETNTPPYNGYLSEHRKQLLPVLNQFREDFRGLATKLFIPFNRKKNDFLLQEGEIDKCIWILKKGFAHRFCNRCDNAITCNFYFPGEFICSYPSAILQNNSSVSIQLLDNSIGWYFDCNKMDEVRPHFKLIDQLEKKIIACYLEQIDQKKIRLQTLSAQQNYQFLVDHHPEYIQQIPLNLIASYLGINPGSLSRIRGVN